MLMFYLTVVNKILRHCHSWLARQYLGYFSSDLRPKSAFPTSKARKRGSRNTSISGQPGSGRYSFYTGSDVGSSLIGSRPTSGYTSRVTSARTLR